MLVFEERWKPEYPEKNLSEQAREPTTNSTLGVDAAIWIRTTLVGGECSHHFITAPSLSILSCKERVKDTRSNG